MNCLNNCYIMGPTGATGKNGVSETIMIRNTITTNPNDMAKVVDVTGSPNHILDFYIPKGNNGNSVNIKGSYNSLEELLKNHPDGNINDAYLINGYLYVWNDEDKNWTNVGRIQGPIGPTGARGEKGDIGPTGPSGKEKIGSVYLVTFESIEKDGIEVMENSVIPISRKEFDNKNIINLDLNNNEFTFNRVGSYRVSFVIISTIKSNMQFDPTTSIVSYGLREKGTDNIYVGSSQWIYNDYPLPVFAQGVLSVVDTNAKYELVNLAKHSVYLKTPSISNINTNSYFANSPVTMIIDELESKSS